MSLTAQDQSFIKTVAHFDVLDYPLTLLEIARFNELGLPAAEISAALDQEPLSLVISQRQGLYFLQGRDRIISQKLNRYRIALKKLKRARRFAALFSYFPWIRAVAVYSSLALKNSKSEGDIDLFFITAAGRAWSARFWLNIFLKLFGLRPTPGDSRDKLCASYFVDEDNLDLSFANAPSDYFYAYGCASFVFWDCADGLEEKFWQANRWIKGIFPAWRPSHIKAGRKSIGILKRAQALEEFLLGLIPEEACRSWQLRILPQKYRGNNDGKKVALGDGVIKLHDNDKRGKYNKLFEENFKRIINYEQNQ